MIAAMATRSPLARNFLEGAFHSRTALLRLYRLSIVSRAANCHGAIQVSSELCEDAA